LEQVTGPCRDNIKEHFEEHAKDETDHIKVLVQYLKYYETQPTTERLLIEKVEPTLNNILQLQLKYEKMAVENYTKFKGILEDCNLKVDIENILIVETEHMQDLENYLK